MNLEELELAYKEIIDKNDKCKFIRRLFESIFRRFPARLIVDLSDLLSRLSTKKNSSRDYLNVLVRAKTRTKVNKIYYVFFSLRASAIKNNNIYSNNIKE